MALDDNNPDVDVKVRRGSVGGAEGTLLVELGPLMASLRSL